MTLNIFYLKVRFLISPTITSQYRPLLTPSHQIASNFGKKGLWSHVFLKHLTFRPKNRKFTYLWWFWKFCPQTPTWHQILKPIRMLAAISILYHSRTAVPPIFGGTAVRNRKAGIFRTVAQFCAEHKSYSVPNRVFRIFYSNCSEQNFIGFFSEQPFRINTAICSERFLHFFPNRMFANFPLFFWRKGSQNFVRLTEVT